MDTNDNIIRGNLNKIIQNITPNIFGTLSKNKKIFTNKQGVIVEPNDEYIYIDVITSRAYVWKPNDEIYSTLDYGVDLSIYYTQDEINNLLYSKITKTSSIEQLYGTDELGKQISLQYNISPYDKTIVQRTSDGRIKSNSPLEPNDVVTLEHFNNNIGDEVTFSDTEVANAKTLKNISIKGTNWKIEGSSNVIVNNNEPTTKELNTLKVNNTNYKVLNESKVQQMIDTSIGQALLKEY